MPKQLIDQPETVAEPEFRSAVSGTNVDFDDEGPIRPSPPREDLERQPSGNNFGASTEQHQEATKEVGRLIRLPRDPAPRRHFDLLQQWEGVVTNIDDDVVWAEILDLTNQANPSEIVEIPLAEFAVSDRPLLSEGTVFYWSIGYETSSGGTLRRVSEIRVRRTAAWSQRKLEAIKDRARQMYELFANGEEQSTTAQ